MKGHLSRLNSDKTLVLTNSERKNTAGIGSTPTQAAFTRASHNLAEDDSQSVLTKGDLSIINRGRQFMAAPNVQRLLKTSASQEVILNSMPSTPRDYRGSPQ